MQDHSDIVNPGAESPSSQDAVFVQARTVTGVTVQAPPLQVQAVTENGVVTGCSVSRMYTASRAVTGVIGTHIPVIGTGRA